MGKHRPELKNAADAELLINKDADKWATVAQDGWIKSNLTGMQSPNETAAKTKLVEDIVKTLESGLCTKEAFQQVWNNILSASMNPRRVAMDLVDTLNARLKKTASLSRFELTMSNDTMSDNNGNLTVKYADNSNPVLPNKENSFKITYPLTYPLVEKADLKPEDTVIANELEILIAEKVDAWMQYNKVKANPGAPFDEWTKLVKHDANITQDIAYALLGVDKKDLHAIVNDLNSRLEIEGLKVSFNPNSENLMIGKLDSKSGKYFTVGSYDGLSRQ